MGTLIRGGVNYSVGEVNYHAAAIKFAPDKSGMVSTDVNSAILEIFSIVQNACSQFAPHTYTYSETDNNQTFSSFLKDVLMTASKAPGGFKVFDIERGEKHYVGLTVTAGTHCSFTLHKTTEPDDLYYGYFDNSTSDPQYYMYKTISTETNLFDSDLTI